MKNDGIQDTSNCQAGVKKSIDTCTYGTRRIPILMKKHAEI